MMHSVTALAGRLGGIGGPILHKELRVASRRRRSYVLRLVYLAGLTVLVGSAWSEKLGWGTRAFAVYDLVHMPEVGKSIVSRIMLFQLWAAPVIAAVMLSRAVSDEIERRTLGVLMTTPITGWQIVGGKLAGGLWQILLLLATSIPLMALLRVFGGVPLGYILAGTCLTVSTVILVASISLRHSVRNRPMYRVLARVVVAAGVLTFVLPWAVQVVLNGVIVGNARGWPALYYLNPAYAVYAETDRMVSPALTAPGYWPVPCLIALGWSLLYLWRAAKAVRPAALTQIAGESGGDRKARSLGLALVRPFEALPVGPGGAMAASAPPAPSAPAPARDAASRSRGRIRRVRGSPILWKDLRESLFRDRRTGLAAWAIILAGLVWTYFVTAGSRLLDEPAIHTLYVVFFVLIGSVAAPVMAVKTMLAEKESGCWPLLLCTPMTDRRIAFAKAAGVFIRCLPLWGLLVVHMVLFSLTGHVYPVSILHAALLVVQMVVFLGGLGLWLGSICKRVGTAVPLTVVTAAVLWVGIPSTLPHLLDAAGLFSHSYSPGTLGDRNTPRELLTLNPAEQTLVIASGAVRVESRKAPRYAFPEWGLPLAAGAFTRRMAITTAFYVALGAVFVWLTVRRMRRSIFR